MAKATSKRASTPKTTAKAPESGATKKSAKASLTKRSPDSFFGLPLKTWVASARKPKASEARSGVRGYVFALGSRDPKLTRSLFKTYLSKWQLDLLAKNDAESVHFHGTQGPVWILRSPTNDADASPAALEKSGYARFRDLAGSVVTQLSTFKLDKLVVELHELSIEEERAVLIGLELASYSYSENRDNPRKTRKKLPTLLVKGSEALDAGEISSAARLALSMNVARHLVNIPGGELNPRTYSDAVVDLFEGMPGVDVEVWQGERLREERMNLLLAVGAAASEGPRLVRISYRPKGVDAAPIAIVGKGITFDSGGLDIKPSSGMRWMKKDMGGSAASVGLAFWAVSTGLALPLDIYLSIAENAIGGTSFRPGDIITARSGVTVEIGNTDAEGRLVLADALDVAVSQEEKPLAVINIATLTGAIKVGLGADIAGLFSNNDSLANEIEVAGRQTGDLSWRMPLFQPYKSMLRSTFADTNNCSDGGFGGAITAALFLEMFVRDIPWAHLDIYAWKDGSGGAFSESGGNGQPIQALARVLSRMAIGASEGRL